MTHVAILDDDPSVRTALGRLLRTAEMIVDCYATGDQFFASLALNSPDCLIVDLQMPLMSGLDVLKCLRQRHIPIPAIIITAHDEAGSRTACLNAGAVAYLSKPLDIDHLIQTIMKVSGPSPHAVRTSGSPS